MDNDKLFTEFRLEEIEGEKVFVATDETVDREGEILSIDGWELGNFKRNPVMLWSHNHFDLNIGKWSNIRFRTINGKKKMTVAPIFHGITDISKAVAEMVEKGFMNTVSVGFRPFEKDGNKFTKQELLEISFVNVPANPEATQLANSKHFKASTVKTIFGKTPKELNIPEIPDNTTEADIQELQKTVEELNLKIKTLQVADKAKTDSEPKSRSVKGRKPSSDLHIRKLVKVAIRVLNETLRLENEDNKNG